MEVSHSNAPAALDAVAGCLAHANSNVKIIILDTLIWFFMVKRNDMAVNIFFQA